MRRRTLLLGIAVAAVAACSPEASRVRNGGPGADVGNWSDQTPKPATPPAGGRAEPGFREPQRAPGSPPGGVPPKP